LLSSKKCAPIWDSKDLTVHRRGESVESSEPMTEDHSISKISGLGVPSIELLGAMGVENTSQLAQADADVLHMDLTKANNMLAICESSPSPKEVIRWIESAREITGLEGVQFESELESLAEIEEMLVAIPVHGKRLAEQGIKVGDIAVMETVVPGVREKKVFPKTQPIKYPKKEVQPVPVTEEKIVSRSQNDPKRPPVSKRNPIAIPEEKPDIAPLLSKKKEDVRVSVSKGLNEGKKLHSRSFIRGVLNPHTWRMRLASVITLVMFALMPLSLVALGMVMKTKNLWWFIVPGVFLVIFFFYLTVATRMKCRVCGQPVFSPKSCRKHIKAHRIRLLGYIIPTCLHMIVFHWFRCTYCGTSVRLRK
jgi:hypothetical protein